MIHIIFSGESGWDLRRNARESVWASTICFIRVCGRSQLWSRSRSCYIDGRNRPISVSGKNSWTINSKMCSIPWMWPCRPDIQWRLLSSAVSRIWRNSIRKTQTSCGNWDTWRHRCVWACRWRRCSWIWRSAASWRI